MKSKKDETKDVVDFYVEKEEFLNLLTKAKTCLLKSNSIPILEYLCLTNNKIKAFNGVQGIEINFNNPFTICLKGDFISKLVSSYSSEKLKLGYEEKCFRINTASVAVLPSDKFLFNLKELGEENFKLRIEKDFIDTLKFCYEAAHDSIVEEDQNGITMHVKKSGLISFGATNSIALAYSVIPYKEEVFDCSILLPKKFCEILIKLFDDKGYFYEMFFYKDSIVVKGIKIISEDKDGSCEVYDEFTLYTKLNSDIELIDFEEILESYDIKPFEKEEDMLPITKELVEVINRINLVGSKDGNTFAETSKNKLYFTTKSATAKAEDVVIFTKELPEFSCMLNIPNLKMFITNSAKIKFYHKGDDTIFIGRKEDNLLLLNNLGD